MTTASAPTRVELDYAGGERLTMNMGPQHPSAHGVFRAILTLEGETVVGVDAVIGYLHRCHEKLAETLTYAQYPSIASKTDYVAAMTSEFAYVMAAESIGKIEVPKRGAVPARDHRGAAAHRVAPALARHLVHGHGRRARRRRDDLPVLHPRARDDPRSVRVARRRAAALRVLPGRRHPLRHPGRLGRLVPKDDRRHRQPHRRVRGHARGQPVLPGARARRRRHLARAGRGRGHLRTAAARVGRELRPPAVGAVLVVRGLHVQRAGGDRGRLLRPVPGADGGVPRVDQDRPPGARQAAGGPDLVASRL